MEDRAFEAIFAERLLEARMLKGFDRLDAAVKAGVSERSLQGWESGERVPNGFFLFLLAETLGVSMDWLMGRTNKREVNL